MNVARMMDKSLPERDHGHCTDFAYNAGQIYENYQLRHQQEDYACKLLSILQASLETILMEEDRFLILRLDGDLHNLSTDIVEYTPGISYVAISHVWADGLSNPKKNSLNRCKLLHLREIVSKLYIDDLPNDNPLIWLDTLGCPAVDGDGK